VTTKTPIMDSASDGFVHFRSEVFAWEGRNFCTVWDVAKEGNEWIVSRFVVPTDKNGQPQDRGEQESVTEHDSLESALQSVMSDD